LPQSPNFKALNVNNHILDPTKDLNYVYRVNCGGPDYTDHLGNTWLADVHQTGKNAWGSTSWTDDFAGMPAMFGSQRKITDPIANTIDWPLFQTFRYGRDKLQYSFPVADGDYQVELYFAEPWYGLGNINAVGWRLFDVAVNGTTILKDVDLWKEAGHAGAVKKVLKVHVTGGYLSIGFPRVASGQVVISAIAIATADQAVKPAAGGQTTIKNLAVSDTSQTKKYVAETWMDTRDKIYTDSKAAISKLPPNLYGAEWIRMPNSTASGILVSFKVNTEADVYIGIDETIRQKPEWMQTYEDTKTTLQTDADGGRNFNIYQKHFATGSTVTLGENGAAAAQMYTVAVVPTANMEPATDLKPTTSYRAESAQLSAGVVKEEVGGKKCITFKTSAEAQIEWAITTGVGDSHELRIKYLNLTGKKLGAKLKLLAADGTIMKEAILEIGTTLADKWKTAATTTGTSINAGNYKVIVSAENAEGLSISGLEIQ
jgi:beta-galactosidase